MKRNDIIGEISLGDYSRKAKLNQASHAMSKAFGNDQSPEAKEKHTHKINRREVGLNRVKDRHDKARKAEQEKQTADLIARLPELKAEYAQMKAEYKSLGGSNWQYADRDQNLTDAERKARSMEGQMNNLFRQITAAEKAQGNVSEDNLPGQILGTTGDKVTIDNKDGTQTVAPKTSLTRDPTGKGFVLSKTPQPGQPPDANAQADGPKPGEPVFKPATGPTESIQDIARLSGI